MAERLTPGGSGAPPLPSPTAVGSFRPLHPIFLRCPHVGHYRTSSRSPHAPCPPRARSPQPGILQGNLCGCHRKRGPQGARCSGAGRRKRGSRARRRSKVPTEPPTFLRPPRIYVARMGFGVHCCQGRAGQAPPAPDVSTWTLRVGRVSSEFGLNEGTTAMTPNVENGIPFVILSAAGVRVKVKRFPSRNTVVPLSKFLLTSKWDWFCGLRRLRKIRPFLHKGEHQGPR